MKLSATLTIVPVPTPLEVAINRIPILFSVAPINVKSEFPKSNISYSTPTITSGALIISLVIRSKEIEYLSAPGAAKFGVSCALSNNDSSSSEVTICSLIKNPTDFDTVFEYLSTGYD